MFDIQILIFKLLLFNTKNKNMPFNISGLGTQ